MNSERHILSILLENTSGALAHVAGLFAARGYNIESISAAPTENPTVTASRSAAAAMRPRSNKL